MNRNLFNLQIAQYSLLEKKKKADTINISNGIKCYLPELSIEGSSLQSSIPSKTSPASILNAGSGLNITVGDGKNLFNGELMAGYYYAKDFSITNTSSTTYRSLRITLPKGTYTLCFNIRCYILRELLDGAYAQVAYYTQYHTFTTTQDGDVGFTFTAYPTADWVSTNKVSIYEGTYSSTSLPPDGETKTVIFPETIKMAGLDDKIDILKMNHLENKVIYRENTVLYSITGDETITQYSTNPNIYGIALQKAQDNQYDSMALCSHFPSIYTDSASECFTLSGTSLALHNSTFASIDELKTFLQEQYNNGTPVQVLYIPETIIETDLSETEFGQELLSVVQPDGDMVVKASNSNNIITNIFVKYLTHSYYGSLPKITVIEVENNTGVGIEITAPDSSISSQTNTTGNTLIIN